MNRFSVSVKGVLEVNGKYLLRKNQRLECELLGGHLERDDSTAEQRLITEFAEESGIQIEVLEHREPWLYEVGSKNIIIVPYICGAVRIPDVLTDQDGGTLHWLGAEKAAASLMPQGYKDTLRGEIPHRSYSAPSGSFFKIIPGYAESDYYVEVRVRERRAELLRAPLPHRCAPRDLIARVLGAMYEGAKLISEPVGIDRARNTVTLNYRILWQRELRAGGHTPWPTTKSSSAARGSTI